MRKADIYANFYSHELKFMTSIDYDKDIDSFDNERCLVELGDSIEKCNYALVFTNSIIGDADFGLLVTDEQVLNEINKNKNFEILNKIKLKPLKDKWKNYAPKRNDAERYVEIEIFKKLIFEDIEFLDFLERAKINIEDMKLVFKGERIVDNSLAKKISSVLGYDINYWVGVGLIQQHAINKISEKKE